MSESYLKLIPTVPNFVPDIAARERARERLASFVPDASRVTAEVTERVEFISAMGNVETASCPACGVILDDAWWQGAMDVAYDGRGFADLGVTLPCCGASSSLNDLNYYFPQGFARFVLLALDPNVSGLENWQMRELEETLGSELRAIWVHV